MGLFVGEEGRLRLLWRLLLFVLVALAVALLLGPLGPGGLVWGATTLLAGATLSGGLLLALDGRDLRALGFHLSGEAPGECLRGFALGSAVALLVVAVMALFGGLRWTGEPGTAAGWLWGAVGALGFLALPAAAEEALLRGYPLQALGEAWGPGVAVVVTGIAFGLLHIPNPGSDVLSTVNVAAAGVLLGVIYVRTLSLWWATGAHLGWNWAHGYLADVPVSGLEVMDAPFWDGRSAGPDWLGGGAFGPEASVVTTGVVTVASAVLWWGPWLRPGRAARQADPLIGGGEAASGVGPATDDAGTT